MATQEQVTWVARVLGVSIDPEAPVQQVAPPVQEGAAPSSPAPKTPPAELLALFRDSKDEVDVGLSKLQDEMRKTGDEDLIRIADYGMFGMTDGQGVGLMKALFDLRAATPDKQAASLAAARKAAAAYKEKVWQHKLVDLVDQNPFGIEVGIKTRLGPALDAIANAA